MVIDQALTVIDRWSQGLTAQRIGCIWLNPKIVLVCCLFAFQNWYPADCKQTSAILSSIIAILDLVQHK